MSLILLVRNNYIYDLKEKNISVCFFSLAEHDDDENSVELLHLFGTSTPLGIVSPFIRTNFPTDILPYYVYSIGRNYNPHSGQSSCIELIGKIQNHFFSIHTDG